MHFYIEIETQRGWRYLRRGWDATTALTEITMVSLWENTTESPNEAAMWRQRGINTSSGPCSFDNVKRIVAREFHLREIAVRRGEILTANPK